MAESEEAKRVMFRYDEAAHPELDVWLSHQVNKTRSIVYALEKLIAVSGVEQDIIQQTLDQATLIDADAIHKSVNQTDELRKDESK